MSTERFYECFKCGTPTRVRASDLLFHVLHDFPESVPNCECGEKKELLLIPRFAFGAGGNNSKVLDVFHESIKWKDDKDKRMVTFYPFLVVLESTKGKKRTIWMPYWHVKESKPLFGQWAPWMDYRLFAGLLKKANAKGYFRPK